MESPLPDIIPDQPNALEQTIARHEQNAAPLRPGAAAKIIWHDEKKKNKTPYSIVYLHGFKASHGEGVPVHQKIAAKFGCNLYLSRLRGHGRISRRRLGDLTPKKMVQSAVDAWRIGQKIGDRVLLMGTSTGGSLALYLAGTEPCRSSITGLILYSPLIHLYGIQSLLLEHTLGRAFLRSFPGKNYAVHAADPFPSAQRGIWYESYRLNGALALGKMTQNLMKPALFKKIHCPAYIGYYYKNRRRHDRVISTAAVKRMARTLATPPAQLQLKNFPEAGTHVICNGLLSGAVPQVITSTETFLTETLGLMHAI